MKTKLHQYTLLLATFLSYNVAGNAQNLLSNGDFEDYSECPQFLDNIDNANNCINFGGTCDYYNTCVNADGYSVAPNTPFGYQQPLNGNGYAGLTNLQFDPFYREFLGLALSEELILGQKYFVSFYVSPAYLAQTNFGLFSDNIGIKFATSFSSDSSFLANSSTVARATEVVSDTSLWVQIKGSFIADSAYQYAVLGNFYSDQETNYFNDFFYENRSYVFIDGVRVSQDSAYAWHPLEIGYPIEEDWRLFLDPYSRILYLDKSDYTDVLLYIFNIEGKLVTQKYLTGKSGHCDLAGIPDGIYLAQITSPNKSKKVTLKFIIL